MEVDLEDPFEVDLLDAVLFMEDLLVAAFLVAAFFAPDFFVADFFVEDFFVADFFVADFFVAVFFVADFLGLLFFEAVREVDPALFEAAFFLGTFAPSSLASDNPIAIACLGLVTFFPLLPLFNLPDFISLIAVSTFCWLLFEYFAIKR